MSDTMKEPVRVLSGATSSERDIRRAMTEHLASSSVVPDELIFNLGLYMPRQALSRLLFMSELYQRIIDVHGVVMELGVRWGQNVALWCNLRGIYEPFNYNRKVIGFDTFSGFPTVEEADGGRLASGDYGVTEGYEAELSQLLALHEVMSPVAQKRKFELVRGDATDTVPDYLRAHPETIVALAYFDFDLYAPTKACLEAIRDRLPRGAVLAFDELNCPDFPGETQALMETLGVGNLRLRRSPLNPLVSYAVMGD